MRLRDATSRDIEALAALKAGAALHRDRVRDADGRRLRVLVVEDDDEILGFSVLVREAPSTWPTVAPLPQALDLFVHADRRSQGIGTFLLRGLEQILRDAGEEVLYVCVEPEANPRALALYLREGYKALDHEPFEDAWSFVDSDGVRHEGVDRIIRLAKRLPRGDGIRTHDVRLRDRELVLRPMTEADWPDLLRWNQDPVVLHFAEGDVVPLRTLSEVQRIYRGASKAALVLIMEVEGKPIGECWLQRMNLPRILERFPEDADLRRVDMMIGEKALWGSGYGSRALTLLLAYAFEHEGADAVFGWLRRCAGQPA